MWRRWKEISWVTKIGLGAQASLYRGRYICLSRSYPAYQKQKWEVQLSRGKEGNIRWGT